MRAIKRYSNRKLYDTKESRYCTLEQLAVIVRGGEDVQVTMHESGKDVTSMVLLQVLHEQEKFAADAGASQKLPPTGLMRLIRSPASL